MAKAWNGTAEFYIVRAQATLRKGQAGHKPNITQVLDKNLGENTRAGQVSVAARRWGVAKESIVRKRKAMAFEPNMHKPNNRHLNPVRHGQHYRPRRTRHPRPESSGAIYASVLYTISDMLSSILSRPSSGIVSMRHHSGKNTASRSQVRVTMLLPGQILSHSGQPRLLLTRPLR